MPFSRSGRYVSTAQFERDEDVWPPPLPPKNKKQREASAAADHERAVQQANERTAMDADELEAERAFDAARTEQRATDVKEFDTAESLTERLNRRDP